MGSSVPYLGHEPVDQQVLEILVQGDWQVICKRL